MNLIAHCSNSCYNLVAALTLSSRSNLWRKIPIACEKDILSERLFLCRSGPFPQTISAYLPKRRSLLLYRFNCLLCAPFDYHKTSCMATSKPPTIWLTPWQVPYRKKYGSPTSLKVPMTVQHIDRSYLLYQSLQCLHCEFTATIFPSIN